MALTKVTTKGITDNAVDSDKLAPGSVTTAKIGPSAVESSEIGDGTVTADDLASTLDLSPKTVTLSGSTVSALKRPVQDNIALLGFKMAVNDGLTVFNLVDGVVDEFHDESGTDESESSNDTYLAASDLYLNSTTPDGTPVTGGCFSAGFGMASITEPDTSTAGDNPAYEVSSGNATFTVPCGMTSINASVFGAGGGSGFYYNPHHSAGGGGGGGFASGTLAVTGGQTLYINAGEGGSKGGPSPEAGTFDASDGEGKAVSGGGGGGSSGSGGGLSYVGTVNVPQARPAPVPAIAPGIMIVAGSGAGGAYCGACAYGGVGGGLTGSRGRTLTFSNCSACHNGGGGSQTAGGEGVAAEEDGGFLDGGQGSSGSGGGAGYYGGAGGRSAPGPGHGNGGGGSSYYGHPQVTSGATEAAPNSPQTIMPGGESSPLYPQTSQAGKGGPNTPSTGCNQANGNDGYVFLVGSASPITASATSSTIVSTTFSATSVPTSSRIVVFEENIDTPTLNTDIIASVSRDGGTTFTNATLSDSGYVTGSSGQRILTGQATISGQPSGQSMRWKLALANNQVKIHGVALQWS